MGEERDRNEVAYRGIIPLNFRSFSLICHKQEIGVIKAMMKVKKAQGRALFWIVFTLAAAAVIIFLISKWGSIADYLSSLLFS